MWLLPVLSGVSRFAARSFYRLEIAGPPIPSTGPVLLVANHPNSLLDPALVASAASRPVRFLAKSVLFTDSRVGWLVRAAGAIPVFRRTDDPQAASHNVEMFAAVHRELAAGAAVGIFPEGVSHSGSSLARLKTGAARIALGTEAEVGALPVIPIGLLLRDKGVFRSEVLVLRGEAVEWRDLAGRGADDQQAVRELTARLEQGLRQVTVNLERWEDQPLVECAAAIWSAELAAGADDVEQLKRSQAAAEVLADLRRSEASDWQDLAREVNLHRRRLALLGLRPADLDARIDLATGAGWTLRRLPLLGPPAVIVGFAGAIVFWVPYQLTDRLARALRPDPDQSSTYKVLVGAAVYLLWIVLLSILVGWRWGLWLGLGTFLLLPTLGLVAQWIRERWRSAFLDARRFLLLRSRKQIRRRLKEDQRRLASKLEQAYEDWRSTRPMGF